MYRSLLEVVDVPPGVVTVMSTVPVPDGAVAVICVPVFVRIVAVEAPKFTAVAPVKPLPLIVTVVPPPTGPEVGDLPVTLGRAT